MQNESQNIEYKESWGRGFKKIAEEFERASLPLPTIEENGGGVMAIIQRKTIDEVIAERGGDGDVNGGDGGNSGGNVRNPSTHHRMRTFYIAKGLYDLSYWSSTYRKMETVKTD